jgi:phospholipid/cholesterol/gamma-HCH transport system ATP-binding protein
MISAIDISKSFGENHVLKNVSIDFEQGKTNLIIGLSGSGKTVLMKCLVGLLEIDKGSILFDNRNFTVMGFHARKEVRKEIGMLFQGAALFDSLNVEENVMFPLTMFTNMKLDDKRERVDFCLRRVNLVNSNKLFPSELSGGMKKRVAIARAIALNPRYLFCDEPNSGLDPKTASVIDALIAEITAEFNTTTIINTHDMNSVLEIGEQVTYIHNGQKWWQGSKEEILHSDNAELHNFVYSTELLRRLQK